MPKFLGRWVGKVDYDRLVEENEEQKLPLVDSENKFSASIAKGRFIDPPLPWAFATIFFMFLSAYLILTRENSGNQSSFEHGFHTDLAAARSHISTHEIRFTGGPTFADDGTESLRPNLDEPQYVGQPTQEMDDAWKELSRSRYFLLTEDEAREAWGAQHTQFWNDHAGGYLAGLDMMHMIHCLDHVRQSFYPERYSHKGIHGVLHRDHCIDALRQMLMCNGDVTPIPTRWYPGVEPRGLHYIDSDMVHTCRNFDELRAFTWERVNGSLMVQPT